MSHTTNAGPERLDDAALDRATGGAALPPGFDATASSQGVNPLYRTAAELPAVPEAPAQNPVPADQTFPSGQQYAPTDPWAVMDEQADYEERLQREQQEKLGLAQLAPEILMPSTAEPSDSDLLLLQPRSGG